MAEYTVTRDDDLDLIFNGELLANVNDRRGEEKNYNDIAIFKTNRGQYIVSFVEYSNQWGETHKASIHTNVRGVIDALRDDDDKLFGARKEVIKEAGKKDANLQRYSYEVVD